MKKNNFTLVLTLILGLVAGTLIGQMLAAIPSVAFLTKSVDLVWQPKADPLVLKYDLQLQVKLNLLSLAGMAASFWMYRKL